MTPYLRGRSAVRILILVVGASLFVSSAMFASTQPWEQAAFAADPQAVLSAAKAIEVGKDAEVDVFLAERRYVIDEQGCVTRTTHWVYRVNTNDGVKNWADVSAGWEPWHQVKPEINVRVITPDGGVHMLDTKTLIDAPSRGNAEATFEDDRSYHGPIPAVSLGAIIDEYVVVRDTAPFFGGGMVGRFWFGSSVPVQQSRFILETPAGATLRYNIHGLPNASAKKEQIEGKVRLTVEEGFMEAIKRQDSNLPHDVSRWPHGDFTTSTSWQDVAKRYSKALEEKIRPDEVKGFLPEKAKGVSRQQEIQQLVSLLHKEVRYTGVEFGRSRLVPQSPAEVLTRKYGDCKDKAALLVTMLRASGIPANVVLLTASDVQDVDEDMPGLNIFDHAIVFVPGDKNTPDLWIDATAEYAPVGMLPSSDQGRMALVISEQTKALVSTPETKSTDNLNVETREFVLAETGSARVVETSALAGDTSASMRRYYGTMSGDKRNGLQDYVKSMYLAESLTKMDVSDAGDMTKPFTIRLESESAKRGSTGDNDAAVALWPSGLLNNLPAWLRQPEEEDKDDKSAQKKPQRKDDFLLPEAFVYEWRYKVIPPPGFQAHGLPENKVLPIGPAKLSQDFKVEADGTVTGVVRFDTVKRRYTLAEAKEIQTAVQKAQKAPVTMITFDSTGYVLLKAGKIRESLAAYRALITLHPKDGLHHAQLANALLMAGLGDTARREARLATTLEPTSAVAFRTLGWTLEHDLIGRRLERGFDLDGSVQAYRKAIELDPKNVSVKAELAILMEHDSIGERYMAQTKLDDSIKLYREIREADGKSKTNTDYDDNLLYDLLYARRFKEAREFVGELAPSPAHNAIMLAAIAALEGTDKALEKSSAASQNENERGGAIYSAGTLLVRMRMYPEGVKLMTAGVGSQTSSPQVLGLIEGLRTTKKLEEVSLSTDKTPAGVVRLAEIGMQVGGDPKEVLKLFSKNYLDDGKTEQEHLKAIDHERRNFYSRSKGEWPVVVWQDMTISNLKIFADGSDANGYAVKVEWASASPEYFFVVKEGGVYRIVDSPWSNYADVCREVLDRVHAGDLVGARKILDWAHERLKAGDGDDPLSGNFFRRFWSRGKEADQETIEYAAAYLMSGSASNNRAIPILERGLAKATSDNDRLKFDLALAGAYAAAKQWPEMSKAAERLLNAEPLSAKAFNYLNGAASRLKDWRQVDKAIQVRLQNAPDDTETTRLLAYVQTSQANYEKYREIMKKIIDGGKASSSDMNGYAWAALFTGKGVSSDDIEIARRGLGAANNHDFAIMHTLACLYAEVGKTKEARDLLVNALEVAHMDEPDESVWYGFGRIAEQYGEYGAAHDAYKRVESDETKKDNEPGSLSTLNLMLSRMKAVDTELRKTSAAGSL